MVLKPKFEEMQQRTRKFKEVEKSSEKLTSDSVYRLILENIVVAVLITDDSGKITYVSPNTSIVFGISEKDVFAQSYIDQLMGAQFFEITQPKEKGEIKDINWDIKDSNGLTKRLRISPKLVNSPNGAVLYVMHDITDFHEATSRLKDSEVRYKNIFQNILDVYVETRIDGTILEISPSIENLIGYTREELLGTSGIKYYSSSGDRNKHVKELKTKGQTSNYKMALQHRNGSIVPISISSKLSKDDQDNDYIISMVRNESEREKTELMLRKSEERLRQAQKMESIGNLAGGIAHDFNNILSSIIGFTELVLDETPKGTAVEEDLQEVYLAGKRAKDLVAQILAFARQTDEERNPLQPRQVAKEVLSFIRSTIPATIEIQQNLDNEYWIMGNATQVHQVLMNFCTNAAHAMEDSGGVLDVSINDLVFTKKDAPIGMDQGNYVEIKVSDTGVGIAPEIIGSIFEPYFTTKGPGEGTGMGLAMAQGIIESYGGRITVESKLGNGTTFTLYLPATKKRSSHSAYVPEQLPTGTERILLVDDEYPIAKMGSQILERLGYLVTPRTNSIEALELFLAKPNDFDLVVTDMTMPNLTGDNLAVELMKTRPDIPVILCTGYNRKISNEAVMEMGIKAFAYKPMVKADLAKTVRKVLDDAKVTPRQ